jgi:exonuclease III
MTGIIMQSVGSRPNVNIPQLTSPTDYYPDGRTHATSEVHKIYQAGRALATPFEYGVYKMISVFKRSMKPNVDGSLPSPKLEKAKRVADFLIGACATIIGLVPAILGGACMSFANIFRKDFTVVRPENPAPLSLTMPESIRRDGFRITSFNVAALPAILQGINHMPPLEERMEEVILYLINLDPPSDAVCLQELFDETMIEKLLTDERLRAKYPHMIAGAGRQTFGVNSGLAILSRYPIEDPEFRGYKDLSDEDAYSKKGVLAGRIRVSEIDEFALFTTHTQAGHQSTDVQARKSELQGLQQFEEAYTPIMQQTRTASDGKQVKLHASFTVGDMNTCPWYADGSRNKEWDSSDIVAFFQTKHVRVPADGQTRDVQTPPVAAAGSEPKIATAWQMGTPYTCWDRSKVALWQKERKELDHMLISRVHSNDIEQAEVHTDETATCSDHLALRGTFKIRA